MFVDCHSTHPRLFRFINVVSCSHFGCGRRYVSGACLALATLWSIIILAHRCASVISFPNCLMDDNNAPATKADIKELTVTIDRKFNKVWEYLDRMMETLGTIDTRAATRMSDHERRITRLEKATGVQS